MSDASHELRTPLTSLRINSELLAADPGLPEAERQEILDRVVAQVAELSQLVAGVTELARGDEPSPRRTPSPRTSLAPPAGTPSPRTSLAAPAGPRFTGPPLARPRWTSSKWTSPRRSPRRWLAPAATGRGPCSPRTWSHAWCAATPSGSRPRSGTCWTTRRSSARPAARSRSACRPASSPCAITDPGSRPVTCPAYSTASTARRKARGVPGSGLGLSIVRQVAAGHGGTVQAESAAGGGTLLRFRLRTLEPESPRDPDATLARSAP